MCRACWETPNGEGVRCNRPDGQFTSVESDQRNRLRNLRNARGALASGDPQAAANSLAHALAAQQRLDGGPLVPTGPMPDSEAPHRDMPVSPSQVQAALGRIDRINAERVRDGRAPLTVSVSKTYEPIGSDDVLAWEQAHVRVEGASPEELAAVSLGNLPATPERRVRTYAVLEAACAATRLNGGVYAKRGEPGGVPDQVDAYINDAPGQRQRLSATQPDKDQAVKVRMWVRSQPSTSDYMSSLRHAVSEDYMSPRDAGIAAGAVAGYQRHLASLDAMDRAQGATGDRPRRVPTGRVSTSRWLSRPGDNVTLTGHVERLVKVYHERRTTAHFLHVIRTPDGDLVRWMASSDQGLQEGDDITLQGTVKAHTEFNGERQTEMYYCKPPRIHATPDARFA